MKTLKYIVSVLILSVCGTASLYAQDTIVDRNVTVEREYKPIIQDAGKITTIPEILEPNVQKTTPIYSEFNLPLNADFNIHTLPAAQLNRQKRREPTVGFTRVGFGSNLNTLADFNFPLVNKPDLKLDFSLNHYGTFTSEAHSVTKTSLSFDKYFDSFDLYAGLGGGHEYLKYYGDNFDTNGNVIKLDTLASNFPYANYREQDLVLINRNIQTYNITDLANDSTSETFLRFKAFAGVRSLPMSTGLRYMAEVKYNVFDARNGLTEHMIQTRGGFDTEQEKNRLGIDFEMDNLMYRSDNPALLNFWNSYTVFAMNPFYSIERTNFNLRLGVKSAFSFIHGRPFNPSADIHAEWKAIPKYFSVYGGITGGYDVNTMDKMFTENRYLFSDVRVKDAYSPYEFYGGVKIKPIYNLLIDGYVDYCRIDNQYFFVNKEYSRVASVLPYPSYASTFTSLYTNRFNVIYSGASHLKIGVRANYNLRNIINVQFKGAYNKWDVSSEAYAWNKPKWESDLSANVHITRNFSVDANIFVDGERYAKLGNMSVRMRPKVDINFGTSYSYSNWFTIFAKVNNVINNPYQNYYGYDVQGFNVLAGAAFSF